MPDPLTARMLDEFREAVDRDSGLLRLMGTLLDLHDLHTERIATLEQDLKTARDLLGRLEIAVYGEAVREHGLRVAGPSSQPADEPAILHASIGTCVCGTTHLPAEAFALNRDAADSLHDQ